MGSSSRPENPGRGVRSVPLHPSRSSLPAGVWLLALILQFFLAAFLPAQEAASDASLREKVEALEVKNRELEARLEALEESRVGDGGPTDGEESSAYEREVPGLGLFAEYGILRATFQLFGDVGFSYQNPEEEDRSHASFFFGSVDVFSTIRIGERFQVLSETVIEAVENDSNFSQERLWASWTFSDYLYAKLGLEHSPLTRWNRIYHHGRWLETTVTRPFLARFEGEGGILPLHNAGFEVGGTVGTRLGNLDYVGVISNGRGERPTTKQRNEDANDSKAFDIGIGFVPAVFQDLRLGGSVRFDDIPEDSDSGDPDRSRSIRAFHGGGHAELRLGNLETIGEIAYVNNKARRSGDKFDHYSWYAQAAYRIGDWAPFTRFDFRNMKSGDPFYASRDRDLDAWLEILGVRYDFIDNAAVKVEFGIGRAERRGESGRTSRGTVVTFAIQLSWLI